MNKILLMTLLCFGFFQAQYNVDKLLMNTGNACMASLLITCAYKEWRHEKGSRLESCLLAGSALGPLGLILYVHKRQVTD